MNLEVRELKQSLERRDAYILELEGKLALAQSGEAVACEPVAYTDGHGMLWLPGERVTMSGTPIPLFAHPATSAPAATGWVAGEVLRRVDSIILDCDTSEGQQTGGYLGVGDLRKIKEAIVAMPTQAPGATPYTGRDQELIDRLWNPPAPSVDGENNHEA